MSIKILIGDCRDVLKTLESNSVHCCVTSPPYYGLRSYLPEGHPDKHLEIGSEPTLQEWVQTMVEVFREVRRVLRPDGTLWLNLGDAYAGSWGAQGRQGETSQMQGRSVMSAQQIAVAQRKVTGTGSVKSLPAGMKAKDMMGQPWRVAFALQDDGWWLRQEIIWHKKNPMPESTRDRCTKAHEHVFLLSKSERYHFDADAIKEPASGGTRSRLPGNVRPAKGQAEYEKTGDEHHRTKAGLLAYAEKQRAKTAGTGVGFGHGTDAAERGRGRVTPKSALASSGNDGAYADDKSARMGRGAGWRVKNNGSFDEAMAVMPETANKRSVWSIASEPFAGAHFATFPTALVEPCILAGCPEGGTVLDPFGGSGTVGLVADRHHRNAILIDLDARNKPMATERIQGESSLFAEVA